MREHTCPYVLTKIIFICSKKRFILEHRKIKDFLANWRSLSVAVCLICARNIVFEHKIYLCVDVVRMVSFLCVKLCFICVSFKIPLINIGFVRVYFEFTLLSNTY